MWQKFKDKTQWIREYRDGSDNEKALWLGYFSLILGVLGYSAYHDLVLGEYLWKLEVILFSSILLYLGTLIYYHDR